MLQITRHIRHNMSYVVSLSTTALSVARGMLEPCKNLYNVRTDFFPTQIRFFHLDDHPSMCGLESSTIRSKALLLIRIKLIQCVYVKEKHVKPMSGLMYQRSFMTPTSQATTFVTCLLCGCLRPFSPFASEST